MASWLTKAAVDRVVTFRAHRGTRVCRYVTAVVRHDSVEDTDSCEILDHFVDPAEDGKVVFDSLVGAVRGWISEREISLTYSVLGRGLRSDLLSQQLADRGWRQKTTRWSTGPL